MKLNKSAVKKGAFFAGGVVLTSFIYENFLKDKIDPQLKKLIGKA